MNLVITWSRNPQSRLRYDYKKLKDYGLHDLVGWINPFTKNDLLIKIDPKFLLVNSNPDPNKP
jgi:hypothetical protein